MSVNNCMQCRFLIGDMCNRPGGRTFRPIFQAGCRLGEPKGKVKEQPKQLSNLGTLLYGKIEEGYHKKETETEEKEFTMDTIIRLADSQLSKDLEDFGGLNIDLKEALEELQANQKKEAAQAAAKEILTLLRDSDDDIIANVKRIRTLKKSMEECRTTIKAIRKAKAYGLATNNFIPLAVLTGKLHPHLVEEKSLLEIDESKLPADWDKKPDSNNQIPIETSV